MIHTFFNPPSTINCRGKLFDLSSPKVMGIINITPDSFYSESRFIGIESVLARANQIIEEGGHIIDVGAYSSRPGADHIDENVEWNRLAPVLENIRKIHPNAILSVDTFRAKIAEKAVKQFEVDIINDISAGSMDVEMFSTIAALKVPYIIMHMQGTPQTMQIMPQYEHLMKEVFLYFAKKVEELTMLGVADIIIDPGFGFGKNLDQNFELLSKLDEFKIFELPILVGLSRKSMIYQLLNQTPKESLNGTSVLNTIALRNGAKILRVHDVKEAVETLILHEKLKSVSK